MQKNVREYFDEGLSKVRLPGQMAVIKPDMEDYIALPPTTTQPELQKWGTSAATEMPA